MGFQNIFNCYRLSQKALLNPDNLSNKYFLVGSKFRQTTKQWNYINITVIQAHSYQSIPKKKIMESCSVFLLQLVSMGCFLQENRKTPNLFQFKYLIEKILTFFNSLLVVIFLASILSVSWGDCTKSLATVICW